MAYSKKQYKINKDKLREILTEKAGTVAQASRDMGMSQNYITNYICQGYVFENIIKFVELLYGVKYDEYKADEEVVEKAEPVIQQTEDVSVVTDVLNKVLSVDSLIYSSVEDGNLNIVSKLDELIMAINKLGNIEMQNMEYLKEIRDMWRK